MLAALRESHRGVALQAFELVQTLIEQHPAARGTLLEAGAVKVRICRAEGVAWTAIHPPGKCLHEHRDSVKLLRNARDART